MADRRTTFSVRYVTGLLSKEENGVENLGKYTCIAMVYLHDTCKVNFCCLLAKCIANYEGSINCPCALNRYVLMGKKPRVTGGVGDMFSGNFCCLCSLL